MNNNLSENTLKLEKWCGENNYLGIDICNNKYIKDESFYKWIYRISGGNEKLSKIILERKFLPAGRILSNRGIDDKKVSLSNCYVMPQVEDSLESIFDIAYKMAKTYSRGGGCGVDLSLLAPRGAKISNAANSTSGAVSFMELYSAVTERISQAGRRGACMISLDCSHPDLEEFIDIKTDLNKVTYANISVKISDDFMLAVENGMEWILRYDRKETGEVIEKTVSASEIFNKLCENNWNYAEPGVLFWDTINEYNLLSNNPEFKYSGINPCKLICGAI